MNGGGSGGRRRVSRGAVPRNRTTAERCGRRRGGARDLCPRVPRVRALHVTCHEDRQGVVAVLFPLRDVGRLNPLPPRVTHRLPGERAGRGLSWQVTSAGGQETFLLIASREPLTEVEREVANLPRASEGQPVAYAELPQPSLDDLRGVTGGLAPGTRPAGPAWACRGALATCGSGACGPPSSCRTRCIVPGL